LFWSNSLSFGQIAKEISVVFHILKAEEDEFLSEERILSQIEVLNEDFQAANNDLNLVPDLFQSSIGNLDVKFKLANLDPLGNVTNGIIRSDTELNLLGDLINFDGRQSVKHDNLGGSEAWDTNRYLNIWVAAKGSVIAESTFPVMAGLDEDGIIIDPKFIGRLDNFNAPLNLGRILTHEIGHYLGLRHLWDEIDDCDISDDGLEDTPMQLNPYFDCPTHPAISCGSADMFMNFMNFTDDACMHFFTKGQVEKMESTLTLERADLVDNDSATVDLENILDALDFAQSANKIVFKLNENLIKLNKLEIFSINGKKLKEIDLSQNFDVHINTNAFISGVYILRFESTKTSFSKKIVILN